MIRTVVFLAASLVFINSVQAADKPKEGPVALEQKLLGEWKGGPCMGRLKFGADGTFERTNYTPGNNKMAGTWLVRWDALPPTLVLTCKTSDAPDRLPEGKVWEFNLLQLDDEAISYTYAEYKDTQPARYTRIKK